MSVMLQVHQSASGYSPVVRTLYLSIQSVSEKIATHFRLMKNQKPDVSCCSCSCLQHLACPCPVITIYCNLSPMAKDILVSTVTSLHTSSSDITNYVIVDFAIAIAILATLKILKGKKVKERIAVNGTPSHCYGVSLAVWDHTVLPSTR